MTLVILLAGTTNGLAGFGFALVGTMALATVIDPATAVVFMIIPILAVIRHPRRHRGCSTLVRARFGFAMDF